jgi:LmbE family N-acetylglucosaminyl deacetylase
MALTTPQSSRVTVQASGKPPLALRRITLVLGGACAAWFTGVLLTTDFAVPTRDVRHFKNVLAVFPHADDETMNCGGTLRRLASAGARITLLLLTGGECGNSRGLPDLALKVVRRREAERVAGILGVSRLMQEDFGDGVVRLYMPDVKSCLSTAIRQIDPDLILTYDLAGFDGHDDHVACAEVLTDLRRTEFPEVPLWYVTLPARLVRMLRIAGQLATPQPMEQRRASPDFRVFVGAQVVPKVRAWYAYRSQRGAIGKGLGKLVPVWLAASTLQFEYFGEAW